MLVVTKKNIEREREEEDQHVESPCTSYSGFKKVSQTCSSFYPWDLFEYLLYVLSCLICDMQISLDRLKTIETVK